MNRNGLPNNRILDIGFDPEGAIWASTPNGNSKFVCGDLLLIPYTLSHIKEMIGKAGLRISRIQTMNFPVRPLTFSRIFVTVRNDER